LRRAVDGDERYFVGDFRGYDGHDVTSLNKQESKRFFLKKEAKTSTRLSRTSPRQPCKSFLVLFFKIELFPSR
jgi:hypothetical protein